MTQEDIISKIVLETATKEDFFYISTDFEPWIQFITQKNVEATLFSFGLKVTTGNTYIEIRQIHYPNHALYTIVRGSFHTNNSTKVNSIVHKGVRLFPV